MLGNSVLLRWIRSRSFVTRADFNWFSLGPVTTNRAMNQQMVHTTACVFISMARALFATSTASANWGLTRFNSSNVVLVTSASPPGPWFQEGCLQRLYNTAAAHCG